jgi:hypothetical protein
VTLTAGELETKGLIELRGKRPAADHKDPEAAETF